MKKLFAILMLLCIGVLSAEASTHHTTVKASKTHNQLSTHKSAPKKQHKIIYHRAGNKTHQAIKEIFLTEKRYDPLFKQWANIYTPYADYKLLKAVCTVESKLQPKARSNHGARGLCQIMPGTWQVVNKHVPQVPKSGYYEPTHSIHAAAYHLNQLNEFWDDYKYDNNKTKLILASYNAGEGNIAKAQKLCKNVRHYEGIMRCLPKVTHEHAEETKAYVSLVMDTYSTM